jgi:hypothetical protein
MYEQTISASISYERCCDRYKHVAASALADNDVP